jgi:2-hydroxy-6-oxonona-2,4-dienedioate hydrolase
MAIKEENVNIAGIQTRLLRGGTQGEPIVFVHGGVPGQTLYCGSADLWGASLDLFAQKRQVIALDMPGSGGTSGTSGDWLSVTAFARHIRAAVMALQLGPAHIVGHDQGGLVALAFAMDAPALAKSVTIVASPAAAPMGDAIANFTLANPPPPLWSRASQAWAFERLSYSHHHINAALLDRCVEWSKGTGHQEALAALKADAYQRFYVPSIGQTKGRFYELCRGTGLAVPVEIVWAANDPLTTIEHGVELYRAAAAGQTAAHFHVINRAGSLPFREEPETFHQIVHSFHEGLAG